MNTIYAAVSALSAVAVLVGAAWLAVRLLGQAAGILARLWLRRLARKQPPAPPQTALTGYVLKPPDQPDPEASERLWRELDSLPPPVAAPDPRIPPDPGYPGWYDRASDRAAPHPEVRHGAGAARYFARNMHDHRRGPNNCPACSKGGN